VGGGALAAGAVVVALAWAVVRAQAPPAGPEPVVWNHTVCSRCGMLVGEPGFAAQLHGEDGAVHNFDDPGCLLLFESEQASAPAAVWLHHRDEDRWLARAQAGFAVVESTPMGYGLSVVDAGAPGSLGWESALQHARRLDADRSGP